jgi:hypothetical protein
MYTITNDNHDDKKKIVPSPLCVNEINHAIDMACSNATSDTTLPSKLHSIHWKRRHKTHQSSYLLYSIIGETNDATSSKLSAPDSTHVTTTTTTNAIIEVTFYFAYSTWDGRILYIDQIDNSINDDDPNINNDNTTPLIMIVIYQLLAKVATALNCRRYVNVFLENLLRRTDLYRFHVSFDLLYHIFLTLHTRNSANVGSLGNIP